MSFRNDVEVTWTESPRIITVRAPSTSISIQDLVDTLRVLEMDPLWFAEDHLIDVAGKEPLGGGVLVGLTATLRNAQIAFEARPGPDWVLCTIRDGNLVAQDAAGDVIDTRRPTAYVSVDRAASSSATLIPSDANLEYLEELASMVWDASLVGRDPNTAGDVLSRLSTARAEAIDLIPGLRDDASLLVKLMRNRLVLTAGSTDNWTLYDDDSVTPLLTWSVKGIDNGAIRLKPGQPTQRTRGEAP